MQYSIAKEILQKAWYIDAATFAEYAPLAFNVLKGIHFEEEPEPEDNIPYFFNSAKQERVDPNDEGKAEDEEIYINVIPVRGPMLKHDMLCGPVGTRTLSKRLLRGDSDPSVIGTILIFETGGGSADAVPELADAIEQAEKPVLSWVDGICASAGIYSAAYSDEIMASRETDRVGSIGTMMMMEGREKVSKDNDNNIYIRVYADEATQKNEEFEKAMNELDVSLIKERILNPHNDQFIQDMRNQRPNVTDDQLKGRLYTAEESLGTLVDSIGSFDKAVERVVELSKQNKNQNNTQQSKTMNRFKNVNNALGVESLEFPEGYTSLSIAQVEAIDNQLTNLEEGKTNAENDLKAANDKVTKKDQKIQELQNEVKELKEGPGAKRTEIKKQTDESKTKDESDDMLTNEDIEMFNQITD
jgi:ClpP class serine protease